MAHPSISQYSTGKPEIVSVAERNREKCNWAERLVQKSQLFKWNVKLNVYFARTELLYVTNSLRTAIIRAPYALKCGKKIGKKTPKQLLQQCLIAGSSAHEFSQLCTSQKVWTEKFPGFFKSCFWTGQSTSMLNNMHKNACIMYCRHTYTLFFN